MSVPPFAIFDFLAAAPFSRVGEALPLAFALLALWGRGRARGDEFADGDGDHNGAATGESAGLRSQLHMAQERHRLLWTQAREGFFECDAQGHFRDVNPALLRLLGAENLDAALMTGADFGSALWVENQSHDNFLLALQVHGEAADFEAQLRRPDGQTVWTQWTARALKSDDGQLIGYCGSIDDISREKTAEDRLMRHAFHDKTTGLPDRSLFMERIGAQLKRGARDSDYRFAVLVLDLDRFKAVNDSLGLMAGDQLLSSTARKLEAVLRGGDFLARLGGDEFGVVLEDTPSLDLVNQLAERIQKRLALPTTIGTQEVFSTVSIGIVVADGAASREARPDNLLRDAEAAMYRAKEKGRARHEIFDVSSRPVNAPNVMQLESDLRRAVERNEFQLYYQPIVSLASGRIIGFEALIRWLHPKRGFVSPAQFIPIAEDTGLILPIGHWVLRQACTQLAKWHKRGGRDASLMMSINLSAKQFAQPDLVRQIDRILKATGLDGGSVKLEITESAIMGNPDAAISMLNQFKAYGIKLSLDDFGTGYSSLSYLHRFPFNVLKIDQSFVSAMDAAEKNEEIVRTIVALAHTLRMDVIAEGVETEQQLEHLRALKCHYGQGYYFAGPLDADSAEEMIVAAPQW